jgi:hypothetical protein
LGSILISGILLLLLVAASIAMILKIRSWMSDSSGSQDRWETTLSEYRNLRNKGVLSDEEYRKIRTLVEPGGRGSVPPEGTAALGSAAFDRSDADGHISGDDAPPART